MYSKTMDAPWNPTWFGEFALASYLAAKEAAAVALLPATLWQVTGEDAPRFLHNLCTQEVKGLLPGQSAEAFMTNVQGKTAGHATLHRLTSGLLCQGEPRQAEVWGKQFTKYHINERVEFQDLSITHTTLCLWGPQAAHWVGNLIGMDSSELAALPSCAPWPDCQDAWITHHDRFGTPVWCLILPAEQAFALHGKLLAQGVEELHPAALLALRIEARLPEFGVDFSSANLPQELDRDRQAISFAKGCYLGQETVARLDAIGHVNKLWRVLRLARPVDLADADPANWPPLLPVQFAQAVNLAANPPGQDAPAAAKELGRITSVVWSPQEQACLAGGMVARGVHTGGSQISWHGILAEVC